MTLLVHGLGVAHPEFSMSQEEATELGKTVCCSTDKQRRVLEVVFRRSRVHNRYTCVPHRIALDWVGAEEGDHVGGQSLGPTMAERMALFEHNAGALAIAASRNAVLESGWNPADITHLVTVTCTGFYAPGFDVALMQSLPLRATTERLQVGFMGCHGAVNGLRAALGLAANPANRVLLCAVELCSLHYRFTWDPDRLIGNAIFADGAAAVACGGDAAADAICQVAATGSCLFPDSEDDLTWRIGNHGFELKLGSRVPDLIGAHLRPWLEEWLAGQGLSLEAVRSWAVHPGGPRIVSSVEQALDLPPEATAVSREILEKYGNMSSPTVLFVLDQLRREPGHLPCVMLGFGPGLIAEAALLV